MTLRYIRPQKIRLSKYSWTLPLATWEMRSTLFIIDFSWLSNGNPYFYSPIHFSFTDYVRFFYLVMYLLMWWGNTVLSCEFFIRQEFCFFLYIFFIYIYNLWESTTSHIHAISVQNWVLGYGASHTLFIELRKALNSK